LRKLNGEGVYILSVVTLFSRQELDFFVLRGQKSNVVWTVSSSLSFGIYTVKQFSSCVASSGSESVVTIDLRGWRRCLQRTVDAVRSILPFNRTSRFWCVI